MTELIRVIDFETTGLPPDSSVCEAAYVDIVGGALDSTWHRLVQPTTEMTLEALATHHITPDEAKVNGIPWEEAKAILEIKDGIYVAHNADFEKQFFNPEGSEWIDTWKVALRIWPDAPSHSNQVLRYFLNLEVGVRAMPPHRALPDAWVTAHILDRALQKVTVNEMVHWSSEPAYLTKLTFGKHRGKRYSEVPRDYLEWLCRQDMDASVLAAARRTLAS